MPLEMSIFAPPNALSMISRRNIRVKVMQCLYAAEAESGAMPIEKAMSLLKKYLDQTADLFTFTVYLLTEVARYAETDAKNRAAKHLPSYQDLHVNTKLAGNTLLWNILEAKGFNSTVEERGLANLLDQEVVRKIYLKLTDTPQYKEYIALESREKKSEKELLGFIFTDLMMADESITEMLEEHFVQWDDDADMIYQMVLNFLSKPGSCTFSEIAGPEKTRYAKSLLQTAIEKKELTMDLIKPKLKNWDPERIAVLDMIMIRMGVCELLFFETIPVKVTINEYIDLAKSYSTTQSGHFVNGILDSIHKDLFAAGRLDKVDFKKNKGN
jgi:transcription antitermination protein NusB